MRCSPRPPVPRRLRGGRRRLTPVTPPRARSYAMRRYSRFQGYAWLGAVAVGGGVALAARTLKSPPPPPPQQQQHQQQR